MQLRGILYLLVVCVLVWRPSGCGSVAISGSDNVRPRAALHGTVLLGSHLLAIPGIALGAVQLQYDEATGKILRIPVAKEKILPSQSPLHFPKQAASVAKNFDEQTTDHQSAVAYVHELHHGGEGSGPSWSGLVWTRTPLLSEQRMQFDQEQLNRLLMNGQIAMSNSKRTGWRRLIPFRRQAVPNGTGFLPFPGGFSQGTTLATLFDRHGGVDNAIDALKRTVAEDPNDASAWNDLGNAYCAKGDAAKAIDSFEKALRMSRQPEYFMNLGGVRFALGEHEEAIRLFNLGLQISPNNFMLLFSLGSAYAAVGRKDEAVKSFETVMKLQPDFASTEHQLRILKRDLRRNAIWRSPITWTLVCFFFVGVYASPGVVEYFAMREGKGKHGISDARKRAAKAKLAAAALAGEAEQHGGAGKAGAGEGGDAQHQPLTRRKGGRGGGGGGGRSGGGS